MKVCHEARAQKKSESGTSRLRRTVAYLRVPELTTPQKNMKTEGISQATDLPTHSDSHEISIQRKRLKRGGPTLGGPPAVKGVWLPTKMSLRWPVRGRMMSGAASSRPTGTT